MRTRLLCSRPTCMTPIGWRHESACGDRGQDPPEDIPDHPELAVAGEWVCRDCFEQEALDEEAAASEEKAEATREAAWIAEEGEDRE